MEEEESETDSDFLDDDSEDSASQALLSHPTLEIGHNVLKKVLLIRRPAFFHLYTVILGLMIQFTKAIFKLDDKDPPIRRLYEMFPRLSVAKHKLEQKIKAELF